ncbi:hypothetical protein SprV_0401654100 [Sparganum proliferum]
MNNLHKRRITIGSKLDGAIAITLRERRRIQRRLKESHIRQSRKSISEDTQATAANLDEISDDQGRSFVEYEVAETQFPNAKEKYSNIPATGDGEDGDNNYVKKVRKSGTLKALSGHQTSGYTGGQKLAPSGPHLSFNANPCEYTCTGLPPRKPIKQPDNVVRRRTTVEQPEEWQRVQHSVEGEAKYEGQKKVRPLDFTDLDGEIELTKSVSLADFMRGDSSMATDNFKITELVPIQSVEPRLSVSIQAPVNVQASNTAVRILSKGEIMEAEVGSYEELVGLEPQCCPVEAGHIETVKPTTQDTCCEFDIGRSVIFSPPQTNVSATDRRDLLPPEDSSISTEERRKGNTWRFCGFGFLLRMCSMRGRRKRGPKHQGDCEIDKQLLNPVRTTPSPQEQPVTDSEYSNPLLPSPMVMMMPASAESSVRSVPQDAGVKTITYSEHISDGTLSQVKLIESGAYAATPRSAYNSMARLPVSTTHVKRELTEREQRPTELEESNFAGQPSMDIKVALECDLIPDEEIKKMRRPKVLTSPYQQTDTVSFSEMGSGYGSPDFEQQAALPEVLSTDDSRSYSLAVSNRLANDTERQAEDAEDVGSTSSMSLETFKAKPKSISETSAVDRWSPLSEVTPCYAQMHLSEHSTIGLGVIAQTAKPLQRIGLVCRDQGSIVQTNCCNGEGRLDHGQLLTRGGLWIDWSAISLSRKKTRKTGVLSGTDISSGREDNERGLSEMSSENELASLPFSGLFRAKIVHHGRANFHYATPRQRPKEALKALALTVPPGPAIQEREVGEGQTGHNVAKITWQQIRSRCQTLRNGGRNNFSRYIPFVESVSLQTSSNEGHAESSPNISCEVSFGGDQTSLGISSGFETPTLQKQASYAHTSRPSTILKGSRDRTTEPGGGYHAGRATYLPDSDRIAAPEALFSDCCHTGVTHVVIDDEDDMCVDQAGHSEYRGDRIPKSRTSARSQRTFQTELRILDELKQVLSQTNNNNSVLCGKLEEATTEKTVPVGNIDSSERISAQDYALPGTPKKPQTLLAQLREARELGIGVPSLPTPSYSWDRIRDEAENPSNSVQTRPRRRKNKPLEKSTPAPTLPKQSPATSTKTPSISDILENLRKVKEAEEKLKSCKQEKLMEEREVAGKDMQPLTASEAITQMTGAPIVDFKERRRLRQQSKIEEERKELLAMTENALKDRKEQQRRITQNDSSQLGELLFCGSTKAMFDPNAPTLERVPSTRPASQTKTRVFVPVAPEAETNTQFAKLSGTDRNNSVPGGGGGECNAEGRPLATSNVDAVKPIPELRVQTPTVKGDSSSTSEGERKTDRKDKLDSQATDVSCDTSTLQPACSGCNPLPFFAGTHQKTMCMCCSNTPMWGPCNHMQPPVILQPPVAYALPPYAQALPPWNYQPQLQWMPQLPPPQWNQVPLLTTEVLPQPQQLPTWPEPQDYWPHGVRRKDVKISFSKSSPSSRSSSSTGMQTLQSHSSCSTSSTSSSLFLTSGRSSSTTSTGSGGSETSYWYDLA